MILYCDFCKEDGKMKKARYDARTTFGYWAYLCEPCFGFAGVGLGVGKGQVLKRINTETKGGTENE